MVERQKHIRDRVTHPSPRIDSSIAASANNYFILLFISSTILLYCTLHGTMKIGNETVHAIEIDGIRETGLKKKGK